MKTVESRSYRVSERVVLMPGDVFRAKGGPYYTSRNEQGKRVKINMAAKGPFVFYALFECGRKKWIYAFSQNEHSFTTLPLTRWRTIDLPNFVNRPYKITGKVRQKR